MSVRLSPAIVATAALACLAGCAGPARIQDGVAISDPYEAGNRRVHAFNKGLDARVIAPVARRIKGDDQRPDDGRMGPEDLVINMGANLSLPGKAVNSLLQGRPGPAVRNSARFAVNSTLGVLGMFDPAGFSFDLTETDTDFGHTLAVWGVPEGAYLELPVLGPSTTRDTAGRVVDLFIDPLNHVLTDRQAATAFVLRVAGKAAERARFGDTIEGVMQGSADSYAQTRLIYLMHRRHDLGEQANDLDPYAATGDDAGAIDPYADAAGG